MTSERTIIDCVLASKKQFEDTNNHTNRSTIKRIAVFFTGLLDNTFF